MRLCCRHDCLYRRMTIYFVAGEVSADNHGAALMRSLGELDPKLKFIGRGGPQMQEIADNQFKNWIGDAAVLGLWEVLRKYGYFREQFRETIKEILESKSDAVVLIDYPGFNLRLARALQRQSRRPKIIYYISPQVWAWNRGRIKRMARCIDLVLCIFPFEADLYNESGLRAIFVGHPMIERLQASKLDGERDPNLIGLFPGSRLREARKIFPVMIETARLLLQSNPTLRFQVAAASDELAREMSQMLNPHLYPLPLAKGEETTQAPNESQPILAREGMTRTSLPSLRGEGRVRSEASQNPEVIQIKIGETTALMQRAFIGVVASGSATLEAAYFRMPFVLIYKVAVPTYLAARLVVSVKYLGMPNLLAGKEVVPEFIQHRAKPAAIAKAVQLLMKDARARERMISEFDAIVGRLQGATVSPGTSVAAGEGGCPPERSADRPSLMGKSRASQRAAQVIVEEIRRSIPKGFN
ncbi:MAG: lipid-A-disaccharide synthase [Verrucomicrobia bacterium]|nr:MAG: lipid-A-disaccharide synthase [Verrucomicrobiota bacterium]